MARNRRPGETPFVPTRGPTETPLGLLLRARRFRVAVGAERVAANLVAHGAQLAPDAPAWIGAAAPPPDSPTLSLGAEPGTIGPASYGFLNNAQPGLGAVVALDTPILSALPRPGRLGIVVPERAALPDLVPLLCARAVPVAWLISIGHGDPAEVIRFLSEDASTDAIALVLGDGARPATLRATVGAKPTVVLGGDPLCRAVARRAGAHVVDRIGEWLALAAFVGSGASFDDPVELWIVGGGEDWVRREMARYQVTVPLRVLDERDPDALEKARAGLTGPGVVVVIGTGLELPQADSDDELRLVLADTRQPEQVSRLLKALGTQRRRDRGEDLDTQLAAPTAPRDAALAARVREETDGLLSDHDAKRLFKAWGIRVTRQGPTGTPTGAVKLARLIGLPAVIARGTDERIAESIPEVRRVAALLLEAASEEPRSVMVRERYAETPRAKVRIAQERGVGLSMKVGEAIALLPLDPNEALRLAQQSGARRAVDQRTIASVLIALGAAALAENATFELELYTGPEPVVLSASGTLKR